jgi:predicted dehydrogenase
VDLALWFLDDFEVNTVKSPSLTKGLDENSVCFTVKKSNGLEGRFDVSQSMENYHLPEIGMLIKGSKGTMAVNSDKVTVKNGEESLTWYRQDLDDNVFFWLGASEYFRENEYFVKSVLEGRSAEPSFHTASKVDNIIDQVECSVGKNE